MKKSGKFILEVLIVFLSVFNCAFATNFTLSDAAIMSLDWNNSNFYCPPPTPFITSCRDVNGPGVEFDIHFPGNSGMDSGFEWVSSRYGGSGVLVSLNISSFDAFELQFKLLSINGSAAMDPSKKIIVGSIIDMGDTWGFRPEVITMTSGQQEVISTTSTDALQINKMVGFTAYIPYWWWSADANPWNPSGSDITLLVKPVAGAVPIPEPITIFLFGIGGIAFVSQYKKGS
ncbi:MAG: hypothetical protein ABSE89_12660 [Sedimentisphaerales bacterium]